MKIGILITARLGSTRLKRKHMLSISGRPVLHYLIGRIVSEFDEEIKSEKIKVIIATSDEKENRDFEVFASDGAAVFYGSIDNIPLRHLEAARAHSLDSIVSVDGDDILCSVKGMRLVFRELGMGKDYVKTSNLPFGMNSVGYSKSFLERSLTGHANDSLETGWGRVFDSRDLEEINVSFPVQDNLLRFTLDYTEDFNFFKAVIEAFGDKIHRLSDEQIVNFVLKNNIHKINEPISREYWDNFHNTMQKEVHQNES